MPQWPDYLDKIDAVIANDINLKSRLSNKQDRYTLAEAENTPEEYFDDILERLPVEARAREEINARLERDGREHFAVILSRQNRWRGMGRKVMEPP